MHPTRWMISRKSVGLGQRGGRASGWAEAAAVAAAAAAATGGGSGSDGGGTAAAAAAVVAGRRAAGSPVSDGTREDLDEDALIVPIDEQAELLPY